MFNIEDYKVLLNCLVVAGESAKGKAISSDDEWMLDAETLFNKLFYHAASAFDLYSGTKVALPRVKCNFYDFTSIGTISRAAMECLFTFYYLFVNPECKEQQDFRYWCWLIDGLMYRQQYKPLSPQGKQKLEKELSYIDSIRNKLKSNGKFLELKSNVIDDLLRGKGNAWRRGKSWWELGIESGISERHARMFYTHLCGYSHSNIVSIMQVRDAAARESQKKLCHASLSTNMIIMAYMLKGYQKVFPDSKLCFREDSDDYNLIQMCFEIGSEPLEDVEIDWSKVEL